ncbi:MAG TPA: hypothetical protein VH143_30455 [Kofleriaceae bacterium]|jgi:hypothetical protein|nr:hypothetical protein [Kofleriaceae bacterium]
MSHVPSVRAISISLLAISCLPSCDKDKFQGPQAEVKKTDVKLDLPNVPAFDLPPAPADGSHAVKELRVKGKKLFDTDVTVHGFVTWSYDCATAIRKPGESDKDVQDRIDGTKLVDGKMVGDPTLCERPKFYIGDDKTTPVEKSLWIVDVPRYYNRQELKNTPNKKDRTDPLKCELKADPKTNICGPYAVGDEVVITGSFKNSSPHSERNSDGLLVYKKMKNITQNWESPDVPPPDAGSGAAPAGGPAKPSPQDVANHKG